MEKPKQKPQFPVWPFVVAVIITIFFVGLVLIWQNNKMDELRKDIAAERRAVPIEVQKVQPTEQKPVEVVEQEEDKVTTIIQAEDLTTGWQTYSDKNFEFMYPANFFYQQPKVVSISCKNVDIAKECPNIDEAVKEAMGYSIDSVLASGLPTSYYWDNDKGEKLKINNQPFCLYRHIEGAAGSTFINHFYATVLDSKCLVAQMLVNYTNCTVYGQPGDDAYDDCVLENEKTKQNTLNQVISTFRVNE